jgi:replicative DNA helicase
MIYESIDAEHWLLGGLLANNDAVNEISVTPDDFYYPQHGAVFGQMQKFMAEKGEFSYVDFVVWAQGQTMADAPAVDYIREVAGAALGRDIETIRGYAAMVRELADKRRVLGALKEAEILLDTRPASEVAAMVSASAGNDADESLKTCAQVRNEILAGLSLPSVFHPTGLPSLDTAMGGGMYAGYTYGFCGAEKMGKTTLAHTISAQLRCKHLYVAMEMGAQQIEKRNLARASGVNSLAFLTRDAALLKALPAVPANENIIYYDAPGANVDEILRSVAKAHARYGIEGMIIDYWQLISGQQRGETEEKHLRRSAQTLADYARRRGLWLVLLAQMNQDGKLFGGNGLRKACDQLYMIEEGPSENTRWLRMDASRYTYRADIGGESNPSLVLDTKSGPHFRDIL